MVSKVGLLQSVQFKYYSYLILLEPLDVCHGDALHHPGGVLAVDVSLEHVGHVEDGAVRSGSVRFCY